MAPEYPLVGQVDRIEERSAALLTVADAVVLDAKVSGQLGGTGTAFDWAGVARVLDRQRVRARIVLAGGLNPENVAEAVRVVRASGLPNQTDAVIKVDYRPGVSGALTAKVETVERYLSEPPQPDR